ncbi:3-isopropylmalate dehydratase large subunit [Pseudomonas umsongensis]|uniref:3-isopropylmalate dehydratase large subunit n=1 Tax=Pseudomonas umsongensis TaxID=198618 RepID=UPI00200AB2E0|nr:3-isopropylmalate dehydratase large subunit [Pseudomonas umsongensis]MCK8681851.1 3-isopropylmalate dehydratase large subunit [Pseudomonas umsongensis]
MPRTLFEKLWDRHAVYQDDSGLALLYIDRHLVNEVTSPQAFEGLRAADRKPWRSASIVATADHNVPTRHRMKGIDDDYARLQVEALERNCDELRVAQFRLTDPRHGILHVVAPELGLTLPGMTIVCGDSHTSTHGALGALAFGIGTSEIEHVLATQCLQVAPISPMVVRIEGEPGYCVTAKDLALYLIRKIGTAGATGFAVEFTGNAVSRMSMESRMTLCNMAIEAGARVGLIAVDAITIDYLRQRPLAPKGDLWERAVRYWHTLHSDDSAQFSKEVIIDAGSVEPQVTWGTSPEMVSDILGAVPDPDDESDLIKRHSMKRALRYMGLSPGTPIRDITLDKVFIGSCTNARIEDLRAAADVVQGHHVAQNIRQALVVPGSGLVKAQAEAEGLDQIFLEAGFEWRDAGCSMCLGMNEDRLLPDERCASTSNRNFEGRQGQGGRTHLVSPVMAASAAVAGRFVDVRSL